MKCCKGILSKLSDYIDRELDEENHNNLQSHFADCHACRMVFNTFRKTVELFSKKPDVKLPGDVSDRLHASIGELQRKNRRP